MRFPPGTRFAVDGKRYVATGQRAGFVICVREGEAPTDTNYVAFRTAKLAKDIEAKVAAIARRRDLKESWELAELT